MASTVGAASRSWLPENNGLTPKIAVTPVALYLPALSVCLSGFPHRPLSGCSRFPTGYPELRVPEGQRPEAALGRPDGRRLAFPLVHATFEYLIKLNRRNRCFGSRSSVVLGRYYGECVQPRDASKLIPARPRIQTVKDRSTP